MCVSWCTIKNPFIYLHLIVKPSIQSWKFDMREPLHRRSVSIVDVCARQSGAAARRAARRRRSGARGAGARAGRAPSTTRPSYRACPPCCPPRSPRIRRSNTCVSTYTSAPRTAHLSLISSEHPTGTQQKARCLDPSNERQALKIIGR